MNFCDECDNYLNLQVKVNQITNKNELVYVCRNCDNTIKKTDQKDNCIYKNYYNNNELLVTQYNTKYLEHENTLPRVNNITCPNAECVSNQSTATKDKKANINEVVYVILNKQQMIYQYKCCHCLTTWKNK